MQTRGNGGRQGTETDLGCTGLGGLGALKYRNNKGVNK